MAACEPHPICKILPEMPACDYARLVEDVKAKGLQRPITLFEGMILDGRHRHNACADAGVTPVYEVYQGDDPAGFVASSCIHRNLSITQRGLIAAGFRKYERARAHERKSALNGKTQLPENLPEATTGDARDVAGARMGVSGKTVDTAARILEQGAPELVEKVRDGDITLNEAKQISGFNHATQARIVVLPKKARAAAIATTSTTSVCAKERSKPKIAVDPPGTSLVQILLNGINSLAHVFAEQELCDSVTIAEKFEHGMDWSSGPLVAQYQRCTPVIEALLRIHALRTLRQTNPAFRASPPQAAGGLSALQICTLERDQLICTISRLTKNREIASLPDEKPMTAATQIGHAA